MKKKILALCLVVVLAVTAVTGATLAYFTDTTDAIENVIELGNVDIELTENYPNDQVLIPGALLTKEGFIKNVGEMDAYARLVVAVQHSENTNHKGGFAAKTEVKYDPAVYYEWFNTDVDHIQLADGNWYSVITFTAKEKLAKNDQIMAMGRLGLHADVTYDDLITWGIATEDDKGDITMKDIKVHFAAQAVQADNITAENVDAAGTNGAQSNVDEILDLAFGDISTYSAEKLNTLFNITAPAAAN